MLRYTLRQLEYFVAVGECGSIALASERVNVSSPSISAAIQQLEAEFGLPLFVRQHAHGLSLTSAGRRMLEQAKTVLTEAERMHDLAGNIAGVVRGPLSIGCLVTFAQVILPSLRKGFEAEFPEVRVRNLELNQSEIFSALRQGEVDLAITYDLNIPTDLHFTPLLDLPPYAMVGADHPLARRHDVALDELSTLPMVLLDLPFSADYFLSLFTAQDLVPNVTERTRDMSVMRSLVANGFGYSLANIRLLNDHAPDGKPLKVLPLVGTHRPMCLGVLTSRDAHQASVVRAFQTFAAARLNQGDTAAAVF